MMRSIIIRSCLQGLAVSLTLLLPSIILGAITDSGVLSQSLLGYNQAYENPVFNSLSTLIIGNIYSSTVTSPIEYIIETFKDKHGMIASLHFVSGFVFLALFILITFVAIILNSAIKYFKLDQNNHIQSLFRQYFNVKNLSILLAATIFMSAVLLAVEEFGMASLVSNILFLCAIALIVFSPFISRAQHIRGDDGVFNFRCQIDSKRDIFLAIVISPIAYVVTFLFGAVILWVVNSNIIALFFYLIPVPLILGSLLIMKILFRLEAINIKLILKSFVIATYGWIITFSIIIGVVFSFELFLNRHILFLLIKTEELGIETPVILKYGLQIADNVVLISPSIALALLSFFVLLPTNRLIYGLSENRITDLVDE